MCDAYRVSSSAKVQQMEADLSRQLSALRAEIEETGFPRRAVASRCYSSVPPPKDVSFFRVEREHALRRGLQVAEALPVQSQADVMQRELESCLSLEYTPDSLPPLLHQFYTDRSYHLAQIKYLLMLRWRRFCRHAGVIEKLYPHYKDQMSCLTSEYEDAVQRARRLSASREKILTGRGNVSDLPTQDDVVIYLRWLVCHLHSVQPIHNFLRVLHYIPAEPQPKLREETSHETQHVDGVSGPADGVPRHTVHLEEFLTELQSLVAHFQLTYDTRNLKSTADEMELFSSVWREFRTIFGQQEQMKTFPQYDGSEVSGQWGRKSGRTALRKEASWLPFIQVKPKRDPWQQKLITKLKEKKSVDELLKMNSRFLQVSDLLNVAAALKDHAAHVGNFQSALTSSASRSRETKRQKISKIWTSVYSAASLSQDGRDQFTRSRGRRGHNKKSPTSNTANVSCSLEDRLQLLGLNDNLEEGTSDPIVTRGAYLSLIHLRHLKLRQLQRVSLGLLNYLRSVERTLTFDLAGLQLEEGELCSTAEETGWMNAARGGRGEAGGLGSLQYSHNTPVDCKVRCSEFMEFAEVENLHDFYSAEERLVHAQDQRGLYIVYDAALRDLQELEDELLLVGSRFVQRDGVKRTGSAASLSEDFPSRAGPDVDRVAVLLDLWTCETEFLESKVQLLNCYYEAYQHASGAEERFALARVVTDIMHSRPQLDLNQDYFVQAYRAQIGCLQSHQQLIRGILDNQIEKQRQYLQRIWRDDRKGSTHNFGIPPKHIPKHLVSLGGSGPALMSTFLLEVHPSLCLSSAVYHGLVQTHLELCQLHGATGVTETLVLRQQLLQRALQRWQHLASPGASYSPQIQKDLFSGVFFEDPILVQTVGLSLVRSAEEEDVTPGREKQLFAVETFSKLLELVTIRHRLLESASETAHLAQLYRNAASELGLDAFHLYLRPVQFEVAEQKDKAEQRPVFITAILEDDSAVDRFMPSQLPLSIQELDENQIGRFSFSSQEAVTHLVNKQSIENLQVALASQVTQKNALMSAVKLLCLCHAAENVSRHPSARSEAACHSDKDVNLDSKPGSDINNLQGKSNSSPSKSSARTPTATRERLVKAFVSIQLEKVGLRDEMLNSFVKKKRAVGGLLKTPEEAAKIKRSLIIDFLKKFSTRMSRYCVRAQIVAYYHSLTFLLDDVPSVRQSHFTVGRAIDPKVMLDSGIDLRPEELTFRVRPQQLLSADGMTLFNLWYIPHFSEVLHMFRNVSACGAALHHTLQIVSALHDIVCYLVSFSRLGNTEDSWSCRRGRDEPGSLAADWGGAEGIQVELLDIQHQVDLLSAPDSPQSVGRLLQLRRQVLLLQFDVAVRHLVREEFLSSGDVASYRSVSDNIATALPPLSDGLQPDVFSLSLPIPPPLEARGCQAQRMFPWRSFIACDGLFPLDVWDVPPIENCMQLCLSGLSHRSRLQANAAILGVSLLLEDVLNSEREAGPVRLHGNKDDLLHNGKPDEEAEEEKRKTGLSAPLLQDPVRVQSVLKGFLLLTKQLQVFKEIWTRRRLGAQTFRTPSLCQQCVKLYRAEIFDPSMRALAQHMGKECNYEVLMCGGQSLLPPPGASEVDVEAWQLHNLLESTECDMIRAVQRRINGELTLVLSERTRHDTGLPTELWKKAPLKYSFNPERPQIVETFVQQLMEGAEEAEGQLRVSQHRLQQCLTHLGCSLMERERCSFLLYSQFYEQILQHETRLLYQSEQDLKNLKDSPTSDSHKEVDAACRGMMLQISALQTQVAHLEEEKRTLEEQLGLKFKERYDPLVRHLFCTCIQLKAQLDQYHRQMEQDVSEMVNRIRGEGVDRLIMLRKKHSCTKDNDGLAQLKKEEVHELRRENRRLTALLGQQKALSRWRQAVDQEKLHRQLLETQQREITCRSDALRVKMTSEEEVMILQEELEAARKALSCCRAECSGTKTLLSRKAEELQLARLQSAQEARSRQELDGYREQSLDQMRAAVEDGERQLRGLSEQLDRGGRMNQLHRQRSAKEMRQVRSQLQQELSLKQEAFQQVNRLQDQVTDLGAASSRRTSTAGQSRSDYKRSVSRLRTTNPSAGQQQSSLTHGAVLQDSAAEPRRHRAEAARSRSHTGIERPKAEPSRLRVLTAETLPDP